jgi:hypothetical protein
LQYWALFHLFATLSLLLLMLYHFESLNNNEIIVLGFALFAAIFGYTSVMDRYRWSYAFEWMRLLITFFTLSLALGVLVPSIYWAWMVYVAMASLSLGMLQWTGSTNNAQAA